MKFLGQREMEVAEIQGEIRENRGLNWAYMSIGLIIIFFILGILGFVFLLPNNIFQKLNQNSNTPATSVEQK